MSPTKTPLENPLVPPSFFRANFLLPVRVTLRNASRRGGLSVNGFREKESGNGILKNSYFALGVGFAKEI